MSAINITRSTTSPHVYQRGEVWYFEDESEGENGPFRSEKDAYEALGLYCTCVLEGKGTPEDEARIQELFAAGRAMWKPCSTCTGAGRRICEQDKTCYPP